MDRSTIVELLKGKNLKVTPQRIVVIESVMKLNHPFAEEVFNEIRKLNPGIAKGTLYKILDTLSQEGILIKVFTNKDKMRYDAITINHHHLYDEAGDKIIDYHDSELDQLLKEHFKKNPLSEFSIKEIKLQVIGSKRKNNLKNK